MSRNLSLALATGLVISSFALNHFYGYIPVTVAVMIASTLLAGFPIFRRAFGALRFKIVGIEALVTIASLGALFIGEFWEATAVTYLFMLGDFLEVKTLEKTRSSIKSLLSLAPDTARILKEGKEVVISPTEVKKGDLVVIKPGERIAIDGEVIEGNAFVNQATITGESIPLEKIPQDKVFSATVVESGYLIVKAEKVGKETTFARILELVEDSQDAKAKTQKFLERFSRYYTPMIIVLASVLFLITKDIRLSLTLLVIACPGALVISAPVSIVAGIGNGAKRGILIKGGEAMERLGTLRAIAFDKTGTLTEGKPSVVALYPYNISEQELAFIAGSGETYSEHPLAKAIVEFGVNEKQQTLIKPTESEIIAGKGVSFVLEGKRYLIGNRNLFRENNIETESYEQTLIKEETLGRTVVIVGNEKSVIGLISIADTIRSEAKTLISDLRKVGIKKMVMLTGDNELTAKTISGLLGFDDYKAALLPEDKVTYLKELQKMYHKVGMVGDGVNDAPALAISDVGIAIGGIGTDVAMESSDVVIMSSHLHMLNHAIALSKATVRNMKQNITFALVVAAFLLGGVLFRVVDLSLGMLVHEMSVLLVIINAVRLLNYKSRSID
ncbi:MAG: cation-translocating P-type ATPase [Sphaerochaetaceae bacterium]